MLSMQVRFIGLVAGVGRHAILFRCERIDDTCFKPSAGESPFRRQVIVSSPFHDHDHVLDAVLLLGLANQVYR